MARRYWCGLIALLATLGHVHAADVSGVHFDDVIQISGYDRSLKLSGAAQMERNFLPLYVAALYVPVSTRSTDTLLDGLTPCRISVVWVVPDMTREQVQEYWREALRHAVGKDDFARIAARAEQFVSVLDGIKRKDELFFEYLPDAGMRIRSSKKPLAQLPGVEFNRALLRIWLGALAPAEFRAALTVNLSPK